VFFFSVLCCISLFGMCELLVAFAEVGIFIQNLLNINNLLKDANCQSQMKGVPKKFPHMWQKSNAEVCHSFIFVVEFCCHVGWWKSSRRKSS